MGLMPQKKALVERLKDQPFTFLGVFGREGKREEIAARMKTERINWRNAIEVGEPGEALWSTWAVRGFPQFYLLDAQGVIRRRWFGDPGAELDPAIETLLAETRAAK